MVKHVGWFVTLIVIISLFLYPVGITEAKDTLIIGIQDDVTSLDPAKAYETVSWGISALLYDQLVGYVGDDFTQVVPELAESWEIGADGKTWTFVLRQDAKFASGNPVNADAVVFSLRRVVKLAQPSSWLLTQFGITEESITRIDDFTVQLVLDQQYAPGIVLSSLTWIGASILDPQVVMEHEQDGDMGSAWLETHSAGSGPFVLEQREREEPTEYVLTANEHYWGPKLPFSQIIVKGIQEPVEQAALMEMGEIDIAWNLQPDQVLHLMSNPDIQIIELLTLHIIHFGMNLSYAPLAKPEVRDAIRYAIDYDGLVNIVLQGNAAKIQTIIPSGILGHDPDLPYTRDLAKAKQLLAEAGYPNGFEVEFAHLNYSPWIDLAMEITMHLSEIGIAVKTVPLTPEQLYNYMYSRTFQIYMWYWMPDYADPDNNARAFAHCDSSGDDATVKLPAWVCNYVNVELAKLVEQAAREFDPEKRAAMYKQIAETVRDDGPFVFLYSPIKQYALRAELLDKVLTPPVSYGAFPTLR